MIVSGALLRQLRDDASLVRSCRASSHVSGFSPSNAKGEVMPLD
jgi:hypothetical protein